MKIPTKMKEWRKAFATVLVLPAKFSRGTSGNANAPEIQKHPAAG
jgi:hypothetical protein